MYEFSFDIIFDIIYFLFSAGVTIFLRYKLLAALVSEDDSMVRTHRVCKVNTCFGILASFGLSIVGNFQVRP